MDSTRTTQTGQPILQKSFQTRPDMPLFTKLRERAAAGTFLPSLAKEQHTSSWLMTALLIVIGIPLWLIVTVPAAAVAIAIKIVQKVVGGGPKKMKTDLLIKLSGTKIAVK